MSSQKKISILVPTRSRPSKVGWMQSNIFKTAERPDLVEVLYYVDQDDPERDEYVGCHMIDGGTPKCDITYGPPWGVGRAWNDLWRKATGEIIWMGNDDLKYRQDWDWQLRKAFEEAEAESNDPFWMVYGNDGINGKKHATFPAVTKEWCHVLQYFTPEVFAFFYHDTWIFDVARKLKRARYCEHLEFQHRHWTKFPGDKDETTRRNREHGQQAHDKMVWEATEWQRELSAKILRDAIDKRWAIANWIGAKQRGRQDSSESSSTSTE